MILVRSNRLGVAALVTWVAACSGTVDATIAEPDAPAPGTDGGTPASDGSTSPPLDDGGAPVTDAGTPLDAVAPDGGRDFTSDRSKFFGAARCAGSGLQLCDSFESGTLDTATWTAVGTAPVIDGVQHARGTKALHIKRVGGGVSYLKESKTFPATKNTYFGRMFVWFKSLPTAPGMTYSHWSIAAATGTGVRGEIRISGQMQNTLNHFGVGTDNRVDPAGTGDWTNSDKDPNKAPLAVPLNQWLCIEWMHKGDTNETRFFWDAVEHPSLYTSSTVHGGNANPYILPQFKDVWVGWAEYQTSTETFEMWVDEIAIDHARIGCAL